MHYIEQMLIALTGKPLFTFVNAYVEEGEYGMIKLILEGKNEKELPSEGTSPESSLEDESS